MKTPSKTVKLKKIKARIMWRVKVCGQDIISPRRKGEFTPRFPVAVIDVSDTNALIEQIAEAILEEDDRRFSYIERAERIAKSLGIISPKKGCK